MDLSRFDVQQLNNDFLNSVPFNHLVIDNFFDESFLNEILNETEGGIPPDVTGYGQGMGLPPMQKMGNHPMNVQQSQPLLNETTKAQAQIGAFKDYRALMKTIDKKKKEGFMGGSAAGFSIEGGVPNDFSTID